MATTTVTDRLTRGRDFTVAYLPQLTKGVVNTTPEFIPLRRTTGKPKVAIGYTQDDTIQVTNQGQEQIQDTKEYTMDVEASTSKQSIRLMMQAIHGDQVAFTNSSNLVAALVDGLTVSATAYAALAVGDGFWITGFTNPLLNTFYIVASKGGSNKIVTTIAPVATEAAGATVILTSNQTANDDLPTYNLVQRRTKDNSAAGSVSYLTLYDAVIDTLSLEIPETGISKTNAAFKAEKRVDGNLLISGQTTAAITTDKAVSVVQNIIGFYVDGLSYTCIQKNLTIDINNGYSGDDAAACSRQFARGQFEVSGSMAFRSRISNTLDWEVIYQDGTRKGLGVLISHGGTSDQTYIWIPQAVITEHNQADGSNDVANHEVSFGAEGNAAAAATIMIFTNWV